MRFYTHDLHGKEGKFSWHRQKGQALASAREHAKDVPKGEVVEVERVEMAELPAKELVLAILNGSGYVEDRETVAEIKGRAKPPKKPPKKPNVKSRQESTDDTPSGPPYRW